jgi:hypothetical protein
MILLYYLKYIFPNIYQKEKKKLNEKNVSKEKFCLREKNVQKNIKRKIKKQKNNKRKSWKIICDLFVEMGNLRSFMNDVMATFV